MYFEKQVRIWLRVAVNGNCPRALLISRQMSISCRFERHSSVLRRGIPILQVLADAVTDERA